LDFKRYIFSTHFDKSELDLDSQGGCTSHYQKPEQLDLAWGEQGVWSNTSRYLEDSKYRKHAHRDNKRTSVILRILGAPLWDHSPSLESRFNITNIYDIQLPCSCRWGYVNLST
jgi:hypothetical protein